MSRDKCASTEVQVRAGRHYRVAVTWHQVVDGCSFWAVPVDSLEGWPPGWQRVVASPLAMLRRRHDPWFALIATVDGECPLRLRANEDYVAPRSGELKVYFNDLPWAYGNNHGEIQLRVTTLP